MSTPKGQKISGAADNPLTGYFRSVSKRPVLTADEELTLAKNLKKERDQVAGSISGLSKLVGGNATLQGTFEREGVNLETLQESEYDSARTDALIGLLRQYLAQVETAPGEGDTRKLQEHTDNLEKARDRYMHFKKQMMEGNLRLVVSFAKQYSGKGVLLSDLIQEGNIGLSRAIDRFDYTVGKRFSTYASWWIRQALSRAITDQGKAIRLPVHIARLIRKLTVVARKLEQELGRQPTDAEIAKSAHMPPAKIRETLGLYPNIVSYETPVGEEQDTPMIDFIADPTIPPPVYEVALNMLKSDVGDLLQKAVTDPRELKILEMRFGLHDADTYSLREIGKKYGVSRERIRQIEDRALRRLRAPAEEQGLRGYLELLDYLRSQYRETPV